MKVFLTPCFLCSCESEAEFLNLQNGGQSRSLPQVQAFEHLGILLISDGSMEQYGMDKQTETHSAVMQGLLRSVVVKKNKKKKTTVKK